jgi:hypothetical protein
MRLYCITQFPDATEDKLEQFIRTKYIKHLQNVTKLGNSVRNNIDMASLHLKNKLKGFIKI